MNVSMNFNFYMDTETPMSNACKCGENKRQATIWVAQYVFCSGQSLGISLFVITSSCVEKAPGVSEK